MKKDNVIDYQKITEEVYQIEQKIIDNDNSYPHDLMSDIQYILQFKPENFMVFIKEYCSTSLFEIDNVSPYTLGAQKYYNSYLCMYNFWFTNMDSFNTVLHVFRGKIREYKIGKYSWEKESILITLKFFYEMHYKRFIRSIDENTEEGKKLLEKAQNDYQKNQKVYDIVMAGIKNV